MRIFIVVIFLQCSFVYGQRNLQEVVITDTVATRTMAGVTLFSMKRKEIELLQPNDVGDIIQRAGGVSLRSYGGVGGMKTISVRGLGSQHTTLVVDGFSLQNTQTGQIDLGQLMTENIESIELSNGSLRSNLVPVSALTMGSSLLIETFENSFHSDQQNIRVATKVASFGQHDAYGAMKHSIRSGYLSCFGRYRNSIGAYPYRLENGSQVLFGTRASNAYNDLQGGGTFGFGFKNGGVLAGAIRMENSNQQLPGAVILYAPNGGQYLETSGRRLQLAYSISKSRFGGRFFASAASNGLQYTDSSYLSQSGFLVSEFRNDQIFCGGNAYVKMNANWLATIGLEQQFSRLSIASSVAGSPLRSHNFSLLALKGKYERFWITGQIAQQLVWTEQMDIVKKIYRLHPYLQIDIPINTILSGGIFGLMFRNSMRVPTFNELYYNQIGNASLRPELANQFAASFSRKWCGKKWKNSFKLSAYRNDVKDKIVAVPTKNLFIWSMQNIGRAQITGAEAMFENDLKLNSETSIAVSFVYAFQQAKDITEIDSPTYGDQIAYIPKHSGNMDFTIFYKDNGVRIGLLGMDKRFVLNENIAANQVDGFALLDLSCFRTIQIKKHTWKAQVACKNVFNSSYSYIRYYVMPGRNFHISLSYAFN